VRAVAINPIMTWHAARVLGHAVPDDISFSSWTWVDRLNPIHLLDLSRVLGPSELHRRMKHMNPLLARQATIESDPAVVNGRAGFFLRVRVGWAVSKNRSPDAWHEVG
jgi:hypothetical protein